MALHESQRPSARTLEARRLYRGGGWGYKRIATHFGVSRDTARQWVRPDRRTRRDRERAWRKRTPARRERLYRRAIIVLLWRDGASLNETADRLGITRKHLGVQMTRLRRQGYDLPYRPRPYQRD